MLAGGILLRTQPVQDIADQGEDAVALRRQPFLERLGIDIEIGEEFAAVQLGCRLQVAAVLRARQPLEILEIDESRITRESRFTEDLDADSLALIELVEVLEEEIGERTVGFSVDDEDLDDLHTVGDAVDYVIARLERAGS